MSGHQLDLIIGWITERGPVVAPLPEQRELHVVQPGGWGEDADSFEAPVDALRTQFRQAQGTFLRAELMA